MKSVYLLFTVLCATTLSAQSAPHASTKQAPADMVKAPSQGSLRQGKLPKPEFSPVLPQFFYTVPTYATGGVGANSVGLTEQKVWSHTELKRANKLTS